MFVTTRPLTETMPDGSVHTHPEGACIAKFPEWDNGVKAALLRMQFVREVTDAKDGAELVRATPVPAPNELPKAVLLVKAAPLGSQAPQPSCPHCPGKLFANNQGLKLHMTRKHSGVGATQAHTPS